MWLLLVGNTMRRQSALLNWVDYGSRCYVQLTMRMIQVGHWLTNIMSFANQELYPLFRHNEYLLHNAGGRMLRNRRGHS